MINRQKVLLKVINSRLEQKDITDLLPKEKVYLL